MATENSRKILNKNPQKLIPLLRSIFLNEYGDINENFKLEEINSKSEINIITVEGDLFFVVTTFTTDTKSKQISANFTLTEYFVFNENLDNELYNIVYFGDDSEWTEMLKEEHEIIIEDEDLTYIPNKNNHEKN